MKQEKTIPMVPKGFFVASLLLILDLILVSGSRIYHHNNNNPLDLNSNASSLASLELPDHVNGISSSTASCTFSTSHGNSGESDERVVKLPLRHRTMGQKREGQEFVIESALRDLNRIHTFRRRITEKMNQNVVSKIQNHHRRRLLEEQPKEELDVGMLAGHLVGSLKSGVSLGSGEYFMDVLVGTPPKHFLLIVDTGSDLNWIQCMPCYDCFEQNGPYYDPNHSASFKNVSCQDSRCGHVSPLESPPPCKSRDQSCPYYYWYGDFSNTTGDFSLETFTVNLTAPSGKSEFKKVEDVMFGCGHWNRGLFHGAAGLLGLGRGPLSFSSQLQSLYGHSFSYCLVDRNSDPSVSSKLIFGEDKDLLRHPELNFTKLVNGKDNPADTFYFLEINSIIIGGEALRIPKETWGFTPDGGGGTIIDSGSTLSYFAEPGYELIKEAFIKKIKNYPLVSDFPILNPCYNVSGVETLEMPSFKIKFRDGAEWNFPTENYFIWVDQDVVCLAMLGTKRSGFSIIGNYQQQNFHVLYDTKKSRLGFAPASCAEI